MSATTAGEAVEKAAALLAQGRHIDLGLAQISDRQLARHHLTLATAFDECANLRAGAEHLADDHAWVLAHRRYNSGSTEGGIAYAERVSARVGAIGTPEPALPAPTPDPFSRPSASGRDLLANTSIQWSNKR